VRQLRDVVARHRRCGHDAVPNPWPCFDRRSHSIPDSWTAERRLERLRQVSDAALEGYAAVIQRYLPAFRTQLNTRRLMPVRLRGYQHEDANAEGRIFGRFNEMWYLEPCPRPSQTKSGGLRSTIFRRGTTSRLIYVRHSPRIARISLYRACSTAASSVSTAPGQQ
jgi:hypothetical protein